jgi:uncharacterized protein YaiL (DUF2058 family)
VSDSLQDQLRALGLAKGKPDEGRGKKRGSRKAGRKANRALPAESTREMSLDQAYALREREEKRQSEQARQQKREAERRRRQINQAIREIVTARRQNRADAEIARNFLFNGRIRKVRVTAEQLQALNDDMMGIVYLSGGYHLLEPDAVEAVRGISPEHVVDLGGETGDEESDHPVPDDLIW